MCPREFPDGTEPVIGVAVGVSDATNLQLHVGILHADEGRAARLLHHAWHGLTKDDLLPSQEIPYWWVRVALERDVAETLSGLCRRISRRVQNKQLRIPYGLIYEGGKFADGGTVEYAGREMGLTCTTFVLAIFENVAIHLVDRSTWYSRPEDAEWHRRIIAMLRATQARYQISDAHIAGVERESGCARFRPEEIVAAATALPLSASLDAVTPDAHVVLWSLLGPS